MYTFNRENDVKSMFSQFKDFFTTEMFVKTTSKVCVCFVCVC